MEPQIVNLEDVIRRLGLSREGAATAFSTAFNPGQKYIVKVVGPGWPNLPEKENITYEYS